MSALNILNRRFANVDAKIEQDEREIEKLVEQIEELNGKLEVLKDTLRIDEAVKNEFEEFSKKTHLLDGEMLEYLCIGFAQKHGIDLTEEPEMEIIPEEKDDKRRKVRNREEMKAYHLWYDPIKDACGNLRVNTVIHKAYTYANKVYGFCFAQEKKEFIIEHGRNPIGTTELVFWAEKRNPVYENMLLDCVHTVVNEMKGVA